MRNSEPVQSPHHETQLFGGESTPLLVIADECVEIEFAVFTREYQECVDYALGLGVGHQFPLIARDPCLSAVARNAIPEVVIDRNPEFSDAFRAHKKNALVMAVDDLEFVADVLLAAQLTNAVAERIVVKIPKIVPFPDREIVVFLGLT